MINSPVDSMSCHYSKTPEANQLIHKGGLSWFTVLQGRSLPAPSGGGSSADSISKKHSHPLSICVVSPRCV